MNRFLRRYRIPCLVLAVAMTASMVLTGCKAKDKQQAVSSEHATFTATFIKNQWHGDPNDMAVLKELESKANVTVQWQVYSQATWNDKKNLVLASNDLPDVLYMNAVNQKDISKYGPAGLFVDLEPLIKKDCPQLTAAFKKLPNYKAVCTNPSDGKIYTVARAAVRTANNLNGAVFIYKPWLDKLGLSVPTTMDQFKSVLEAFKTKDPNGNGKADEVPFSFAAYASYDLAPLIAPFGYACASNATTTKFIEDKNTGKAVFVPTTDSYKSAVTYLNGMFQEGLIDQEGYSNSDAKEETALGNSKDVILGSFSAYDSSIIVPADRIKDYVAVPALKGPTGKQIVMEAAANDNVNGTQFVMTKSCKNQDAVMRWLDAHFDPTVSIELFLGPVGTTLKKDSSGMLDYIDTPSGMTYSDFRYKNAPVHVPCFIPADSWGKDIAVMAEDKTRLSLMDSMYSKYMTQTLIFPMATADESAFMLSNGKDIDDYALRTEASWMTSGGIDKGWSEFQAKLKNMGIDKYTQIMQAQIDRFKTAGK